MSERILIGLQPRRLGVFEEVAESLLPLMTLSACTAITSHRWATGIEVLSSSSDGESNGDELLEVHDLAGGCRGLASLLLEAFALY
jgi:hypothetical protein